MMCVRLFYHMMKNQKQKIAGYNMKFFITKRLLFKHFMFVLVTYRQIILHISNIKKIVVVILLE